jgi:hypothetical protein
VFDALDFESRPHAAIRRLFAGIFVKAEYYAGNRTEEKMPGSDSTAKGGLPRDRNRRLAVLVGAPLLLLPAATPAAAQWGPPPWFNPYYHGDYPPPPDEDDGYREPSGISLGDVRRHVAKLGLHLVAKPRRQDDIYLAEAADSNGTLHRLVFSAASGRLLQNTALPPRKKKSAEKPTVSSAPDAAVKQ